MVELKKSKEESYQTTLSGDEEVPPLEWKQKDWMSPSYDSKSPRAQSPDH